MRTAIILTVSLATLSARDLVPEHWIENVPATNDSIQTSLVFRTVAGVAYRLETSENLEDWDTDSEFYGMGHEIATPMREFTAPPPPDPGDPPPVTTFPSHSASLLLRSSSEPEGGTVVSWKSLDDGAPMTFLLEENLHEDWSSMPLYAQNFGDFYFFIFHPQGEAAPPSENPSLGLLDSAMIEELENSFAAINTEVATSAAAARNAPPPAPPTPGSKKFWRIHADWGVDTDLDGSPDWAEFEIASNSNHSSFDLANPFSIDADGNGIPDGQQLDLDQDGTADAIDIAAEDPKVNIITLPESRYGLFQIEGANPPSEKLAPLEINNQGIALYVNGTWKSGQWTLLDSTGVKLEGCFARGINDSGEIVGFGNYQVRDSDNYREFALTRWISMNSEPEVVEDDGLFALPLESFVRNPGEGPVFSNDGSVIANTARIGIPSQGVYPVFIFEGNGGRYLWTLPGAGRTVAQSQVGGGMSMVASKDIYWGFNPSNNKGEVVGFGNIGQLDWTPKRVVSLPPGIPAAFGPDQTLVHYNGAWQNPGILTDAIDMSENGTAIARKNSGMLAPILLNGKWRPATRTAAFDVPQEWRANDVVHLDTSSKGWILTSRGTPESQTFGAMLPLQLEGEYTDSQDNIDNVATGVDGFSVGANSMSLAFKDRLWVMAPQGTVTEVKIKAPLSTSTPMELSADNITFDGQETLTVNSNEKSFLVQASGGVTSGTEILGDLKLGTAESVSKPIGFKVMKSRTLKVLVYKVVKADASGNVEITPTLVPDEGDLEDYLTDVFKPQLNVTVDVKIEPTPLRVNWDVDGVANQSLKGNGINGELSSEQAAIDAAKNAWLQQASQEPEYVPFGEHITVYLVGTAKQMSGNAWATTSRQQKTCWVVGNFVTSLTGNTILPYDPGEGHMHNIAHEIGHILVGYGHPDGDIKGPAPLTGTEHRLRLMCSGSGDLVTVNGQSRMALNLGRFPVA